MVAFKPGYQLHAQFLPFQSFANNGRWRCKWHVHVDEDKGVDDFLHDIEDNDTGYEDEASICCRHSYKCMHIYYIQWKPLYMQNPMFMIFTVKFYSYKQYTNLMKVCSCIIAYVYSQWWYCADISYAFLNMGGVRSRKYCAISDMTTTWGLRREVVLLINLSRASIEAWRMLWHLSSNGSRVWLRNWGKGYMSAERSVQLVSQVGEIKYGNSNSGTFWAATISLGNCHMGSVLSLLEYQYKLYCWMKGTTTRLDVYLR